ncbi:MAG TPA: GIY-YIG nuclease family protein [bacterium]|nr:GIY-YIG nuclease family protein [bacterium]
MSKIVYILTNEAMPGYVKIGLTSNLEQRIRDLDNTSVPLPFECVYACIVKDGDFVEKQLHNAFLDHRVRSSREFFELSPERAISALKLVEIEDVTPNRDYVSSVEDQKALDEARNKRVAFNFKMIDIPIGAELTLWRDENIKAKVIDNRNILFEGEVTSVSAAARKALGINYRISGTDCWVYEGETLDERRRRIEME